MTYEELLAAALATDAFEAKKALADWLFQHGNTGWNGEDWDISDIGAPQRVPHHDPHLRGRGRERELPDFGL